MDVWIADVDPWKGWDVSSGHWKRCLTQSSASDPSWLLHKCVLNFPDCISIFIPNWICFWCFPSCFLPSLFPASKPCCLGSLLKSFISLASHLRVVWCSQGCLSGSKFLPALSCTLPITPWRLFHGISTGTNAAPGLHTGFASTKSALLFPYTGPMRGGPCEANPWLPPWRGSERVSAKKGAKPLKTTCRS